MLVEKINELIRETLKAGEPIRLDTLRMLSAALTYAQIDKMRELTESEELDVVKKEAKKRSDAIDAYTKASAFDRAAKEKQELVVLQEFLPEALSTEQVTELVDAAISSEGDDFGKVMRAVVAKAEGRADGKLISELVRAKLQK